MAQGQGLAGSNATCFTLNSQGGVTFACRSCASASNNPFGNSDRLLLWVKDTSSGGSSAVVPSLRVRLQRTPARIQTLGCGPCYLLCSDRLCVCQIIILCRAAHLCQVAGLAACAA